MSCRIKFYDHHGADLPALRPCRLRESPANQLPADVISPVMVATSTNFPCAGWDVRYQQDGTLDTTYSASGSSRQDFSSFGCDGSLAVRACATTNYQPSTPLRLLQRR